MLAYLKVRTQPKWFGLFGEEVKPFDILLSETGDSYSQAGQNALTMTLKPQTHSCAVGARVATHERLLAHEFGHAIMGTLDSGAGSMRNVNLNENPIMRQLGDHNDRTRY